MRNHNRWLKLLKHVETTTASNGIKNCVMNSKKTGVYKLVGDIKADFKNREWGNMPKPLAPELYIAECHPLIKDRMAPYGTWSGRFLLPFWMVAKSCTS